MLLERAAKKATQLPDMLSNDGLDAGSEIILKNTQEQHFRR